MKAKVCKVLWSGPSHRVVQRAGKAVFVQRRYQDGWADETGKKAFKVLGEAFRQLMHNSQALITMYEGMLDGESKEVSIIQATGETAAAKIVPVNPE